MFTSFLTVLNINVHQLFEHLKGWKQSQNYKKKKQGQSCKCVPKNIGTKRDFALERLICVDKFSPKWTRDREVATILHSVLQEPLYFLKYLIRLKLKFNHIML